jgi:hypothetical protein
MPDADAADALSGLLAVWQFDIREPEVCDL